jgi:predicted amidohydrolase YtcJ
VVELPGATIMPGFVDTHVHLTPTGMSLGNGDVEAAQSARALLAAARTRARSATATVWLQGFDESRWLDPNLPSLSDLDAVTPLPLAIWRADGHVCLANRVAIERSRVGEMPGVERGSDGGPTGRIGREANDGLHRWFAAQLTDHEVRELQLRAATLAAAVGVTSVHEMSMPAGAGLRDLEVLLGHRDRLPVDVVPVVGTMDVRQITDLRLSTIGGDLPVDGSIGARTAAVNLPYTDGGLGATYHEDEVLERFFAAGHQAGLQVGVHAIGDRAIGQVLGAWERVYAALDPGGRRQLRARRHRIEHLEMAGPEELERAAALGIAASVQPVFDARWGHGGDLYEQALGRERAWAMNPFRSMLDRGMEMGAGSDTPVTALDPLAAVAAFESHHDPSQRLTREEALLASTIGGARLAHQEGAKGTLAPGGDADLVAWEGDPRSADLASLRPVLTVSLGRQVHAA